MQWFGTNWGAPINEVCEQIPVPVGELCIACSKSIEISDDGLAMPFLGEGFGTVCYWHLEPCYMESILGPDWKEIQKGVE